MLVVVCLKWGTVFPPDYVNVLYSAVRRNISEPFRFICFTDDPRGLHDGIETRDIPDMGLPEARWQFGCWPKLAVFKPGLVEDATLMLYLDLDLLVMSSLDPFLERARAMRGFHMIREWNYGIWTLVPLRLRPDRGGQGSVLVWTPQEQHHIYSDFMADPEAAYRKAATDQVYLTQTARQLHYLPYEWTASFKRTCLWYYPLNRVFKAIRKPSSAKILVFHGQPRPLDLVREGTARWGTKRKFGHGPVDWVRAYWLQGLKT